MANIHVNKDFDYNKDNNFYTVKMVRKRFPWWIFLLLLPLLLLIKCNKTITVNCYETDNHIPIAEQEVDMQYVPHFVYNDGKFFPSETLKLTRVTDSMGLAVFDELPCSVFSYVFYCMQDAIFSAESQCHESVEVKTNFHFTNHVDLEMQPRREDLHIKLIDKETGDELPDGVLYYTYTDENGQTVTESVQCNAEGIAEIPQMRFCSKIDLLAKCYGYADEERLQASCESLIVPDDASAMRLRPIKDKITFFVKNKKTKEPIPDAECTVTLTTPRGKSESHQVRTSTDGRGYGFYDNAFILSIVAIHAEKTRFKPGDLEGGPFTVEEFIKQPADVRTIWLEPEPLVVEFQNVDSITGNPIAGVKNKIVIIEPDGTRTEIVETSNSNGIFPVKAVENSKIIIDAQKRPAYKDKHREIPSFNEKVDKKVLMEPDYATLKFRTIMSATGNVLPDCKLVITGTISGNIQPNNSGSGVFSVTFRKDELLSITASKNGFITNSTKVNRNTYNELNVANQSRRDIPLKLQYDYSGTDRTKTECYDLLSAPVSFSFDWSLCNGCTLIVIEDSNGNIIDSFGKDYSVNPPKDSNHPSGSGKQTLKSPTQRICIKIQNINGHSCEYHIRF